MDPERSYPGDDFIIAESWEWNVYFKDSWNLSEIGTIVDVGAHIGAYALYCYYHYSNAEIIAFEPDPSNFRLLQENLKLNAVGRITAHQAAIGSITENRRLYLDPRSYSGHSLVKVTGSWVDTEVWTLSQVFEKYDINRCDILKLDCEGAEHEIVMTAPAHMLESIRFMAIEFHPKILDESKLHEMLGHLIQAGFEIDYIDYERLYMPILLSRQVEKTKPFTG